MGLLRQLHILYPGRSNLATYLCRKLSHEVSKTPKQHRVLVSSSTNIYENLALEDWLYERADLEKESILLLWRNTPCVVFGRHQNPWVECHVPYCEKNGIHLVRRKSGGGTVYHDEGNLNCSFLMHESRYNRQRNIQFIIDAVKSRWDIPLSMNKREDILLYDKYKVSGTASKIGRKRTYHHFTLMFDVDKDRLTSTLYTNLEGAKSKATESIRSMVCNLSEHVPGLDFPSLVHVITEHYVRMNQAAEVQNIHPMNKSLFPEIDRYLEEITSWDWIFAKTPKFTIKRSFQGKYMNIDNVLEIEVTIDKGCIHDLKLNILQTVGIEKEAFLMLRVGLEETKLVAADVSRKLSQIKMEWIAKQIYTVQSHSFLDWTLMSLMETLAVFKPRRLNRKDNDCQVGS